MNYRALLWLVPTVPFCLLMHPGCSYEPPATTNPGIGGNNGQGGEATSGSGGSSTGTGGAMAGTGGAMAGTGGSMAGTGGSMTGAGGGTGGSGGCTAGTTQFCSYSGSGNTENSGTCKVSEKTCKNGIWSECSAEVLPTLESCGAGKDTNCDDVTGCAGVAVKASVTEMPTTADDIVMAIAKGKGLSGLDGNTYGVGMRQGNIAIADLENPTNINGSRVLVLRRGPNGGMVDWSGLFTFTDGTGLAHGAAATDVAVLPNGNIAVVGYYMGGMLTIDQTALGNSPEPRSFLAIINSQGAATSVREFGAGGAMILRSVDVDAASNLYLGGNYRGNPQFYSVPLPFTMDENGIIASVQTTGIVNWHRTFEALGYQSVDHIAISANTDPIIGVSFGGSISFKLLNGTSSTLNGGTAADLALMRLVANNGDIKWATQISSPSEMLVGDIAASSTNVAVVGSFRQSIIINGQTTNTQDPATAFEAFLATYDANGGGFKHQMMFQGNGIQEARGVAIDPFEDVVVTGSFTSTLSFDGSSLTNSDPNDRNIFLLKFDPSLSIRWAQPFGDAAAQTATSVAIGDLRGHIYIGGGFRGSLNGFNPAPTSTGAMDAFIAETTN